MNRILLTAIFLIAVHSVSLAQLRNNFRNQGNGQGGERLERLETLKIGYITQKLNLNPEEAQRFFPIYNQYAAEIKEANQDDRQTELDREERIVNIRKKYNTEFRKAISADKVNTFFSLEKDFRQMLQRELQERRQLRQQRLRGN